MKLNIKLNGIVIHLKNDNDNNLTTMKHHVTLLHSKQPACTIQFREEEKSENKTTTKRIVRFKIRHDFKYIFK